MSKKRSNAAEVPEGENTIERVAALQQQAAAPYLVLSGKARPWSGVGLHLLRLLIVRQ